MTQTVYTNYWVNERAEVKRQHGSYQSEEEALEAIHAWWEIHKENHKDISTERTNTGALEIKYGDPNYFYRIEARETENSLPSTSYKVKTKGEIDSLRNKYQLDGEAVLFDELPEPYRDRIILAMGSTEKARNYSYTKEGEPIIELETTDSFAK